MSDEAPRGLERDARVRPYDRNLVQFLPALEPGQRAADRTVWLAEAAAIIRALDPQAQLERVACLARLWVAALKPASGGDVAADLAALGDEAPTYEPVARAVAILRAGPPADRGGARGPGQCWLRRRERPFSGLEVSWREGETIGSGVDDGTRLALSGITPRHAVFETDQGEYWLRALGPGRTGVLELERSPPAEDAVPMPEDLVGAPRDVGYVFVPAPPRGVSCVDHAWIVLGRFVFDHKQL